MKGRSPDLTAARCVLAGLGLLPLPCKTQKPRANSRFHVTSIVWLRRKRRRTNQPTRNALRWPDVRGRPPDGWAKSLVGPPRSLLVEAFPCSTRGVPGERT